MARLFHALAHPVRLQILAALQPGEACVCHLQAVLGLRQAHISQHLMELRRTGLVVNRRDSLNVYYRLAHGQLAELVACARDYLSAAGLALPHPVPTRAGPPPACACPRCQAARTAEPAATDGTPV